MYKKFYLMQKEPFDTHPSPELFYKSSAHQSGWNFLLHGIKTNEPIALMIGEYGAGKTLLCLKLMRLLEKNTRLNSVCISTPTYTFIMLLEKILVKLGISLDAIAPMDEARLQQVIYEYFEKETGERKRFIYIVIDDVQEFSYSFIYKLRLFASYNFSGYFPIRMILFSHPSFFKVLNHKKIIAFGQRIKRIYFLKALGFEETREYIYFRLIHSGATGKPVFEDKAIRFIHNITKGTPRLINNICDNCLLVACSKKCDVIHQSLVEQTLAMGNLSGLEPVLKKIQHPQNPFISSQKTAGNTYGQPVLPADNMYGKKYQEPENENHDQKNRRFQKEDNSRRVAPVRRFEDAPAEKRKKNKFTRKNIVSHYGKTSIIIILILIVLFLSFYLLNQNKADKMYNLQSNIKQTHGAVQENLYSMPDRLYAVENLDMLKTNKKQDTDHDLHK